MKKKLQIRSKWESLPWKKVDVNQGSNDTEDDDKFLNSKNHYDNEKANPNDLFDISDKKGSQKDDYTDGADDPGIFLGLEVIDGSKYKVEKVAVADGFVTKLIIKDDDSSQQEKTDDNIESKSTEAQSKRNQQTDLKESISEEKDRYDGVDFSTLSRKEKNKIKLNKLKEKRKEKALERKRQREEKETPSKEVNDRKRTKKSKDHSKDSENNSCGAESLSLSQQEIDSIRNSWAMATSGLYLHPKICASLYRMGFHSPTPIQASTLAASILGKRDIVGAAPTGSGKTLGYLLPILHSLMTEEDENEQKDKTWPLTALVLCPTRELAMQVSNECNRLINLSQEGETKSTIKCETIVGGLSEQKQKRVLDIKRPALLVCTPGRLWDLLSSGDHEHLNELHYLRFLVIDEADRMVSQGNFPQLSKIFEKIQQANPSLSYLEANAVEDDDTSDDEDRLRGLPGVKGEAKVQMLDENILRMIEAQRSGRPMKDEPDDESRGDDSGSNSDEGDDDTIPEPMEMDDDEYEAEQARVKKELEDSLNVNLDDDEEEEEEPVKRQTFIFSATLSLPPSSHYNIKSQSKTSKKGLKSVDGAIAEIMEKVGAQGQIKVVDLSTSAGDEKKAKGKKSKLTTDSSDQAITTKLPTGLSLYEIKCTQKHKDSHLYAYLTTTEQGASGTALVFCNSIGAVKRVAETLKTLGLPTRTLHAQMEQKGRIASIESLNGKNNRSVVVCTDVAARGLDIPNVASVVHYDVARAIDTFIHRAGRTARGMGENAVGWSVSLVSAAEEKNHQSICKSIRGPMVSNLDPAPIDSRLLSAAQERVNLASKIVACESIESRTNKKNQWFIEASKEAGVDLDEDLLESGLSAGSQRERQQIAEAKQARRQLKVLLAKPMRKQNFGKFLSNVGLKDSIATEKLVRPHIVQQDTVQKKKKIKR